MLCYGEECFCGHYVDDFRRVDGVWRFAVRRFYTYRPPPQWGTIQGSLEIPF